MKYTLFHSLFQNRYVTRDGGAHVGSPSYCQKTSENAQGEHIWASREGKDQMRWGHLTDPTPHIKYSSSHPIKQSLISKISKSLTNLRIAERYRGRMWHVARATLKVSFKRLEKIGDLYTLPDNVKNVRLRWTMTTKQSPPHWKMIMNFSCSKKRNC